MPEKDTGEAAAGERDDPPRGPSPKKGKKPSKKRAKKRRLTTEEREWEELANKKWSFGLSRR